ncbi:MAG TPA: asparagine synthase (glutamine-hydrolyzing) [Methyloceanibacter sp.]|jgi:asparagine synthase (glutamine-hydrolysing)|nr:asparagine synthase (glutamine-hydrolyzing) [Methyloceanibacter sp.]
MCGIAGFLELERRSGTQALEAIAQAMAAKLAHRGPDAHGVFVDADAGLGLGHTRLSIIDLSPAGAQPMASSCGRYVITYNGEIYSGPELRPELEALGHRFRGHSDTEIIVEAIAEWGVRATVERLIGMFAFALFDRKERKLSLVRDRLGIKPLYWGQQNGRIVFASELKAFEALPDWGPEINLDALASYLRFAYVPSPHSIYRGIDKLAPGTGVTIAADGGAEPWTYWSLMEVATRGRAAPLELGAGEAADALESLLGDAVERRLVSDVPLGAFLSGGVDSSTVAALMRAGSNSEVRTYSIGFADKAYDEAPHAKEIAAHLGTEHTELYVSPSEVEDVIPELPTIYDEPFADSSQVPTYLLSKLTRQHVTVALSGDGGDELFAGYNRHRFARVLTGTPEAAAKALACGLSMVGPSLWERLFGLVPQRQRLPHPSEKMFKAAAMLREGQQGAYRALISAWHEPEKLVKRGIELKGPVFDESIVAKLPDALDRMQYLDAATYLPDDILTKVDRASMAVALEVRVPLLDHRVVELTWRLPSRYFLRRGKSKWLLRQILYRHVPKRLVERPKMGFALPIGQWLRGPLRPWADELLSEERLAEGGLLDPAPILARWREHLDKRRNWHQSLWTVLMFQAWREAKGI